VGIFRRGSKAGSDDPFDVRGETTAPSDAAIDQGTDERTDGATDDTSESKAPAVDRSSGPYDSADVPADDGRLDLGGLRIRGVPGMELRLEVDEAADLVVGATAVIGDSAVQLQAFAAPRTAGIWDDIRAEIAESVVAQGGTADESRGVLGTELRTRMPSAGPDGRTVFAPARFVGVDGPRWFLRAVFSGRAAIDDEAMQPLLEVVRETVVVRGDAAMAPREMLTLTLPQTSEEQQPEEQEAEEQEAARDTPPRADDLKPFERGPEITEVR
jgi:Protein of unknown function (DUF3710)